MRRSPLTSPLGNLINGVQDVHGEIQEPSWPQNPSNTYQWLQRAVNKYCNAS